jgi:hypothetical protein
MLLKTIVTAAPCGKYNVHITTNMSITLSATVLRALFANLKNKHLIRCLLRYALPAHLRTLQSSMDNQCSCAMCTITV